MRSRVFALFNQKVAPLSKLLILFEMLEKIFTFIPHLV